MTWISFLAFLFSITAVLVSLYVYRNLDRRVKLNTKKIVENCREPDGESDEDQDMDLKGNIEKEAEELFQYLKEVHGFEDVTTYTELVSKIQGMEVEDEERKKELLNFYDDVIKLEYSDEDISSEEEERLKEEAKELTRTLEHNQGEQEQDRSPE